MKRRLVFCPEINPSSVVLLFEKGSNGDSWSVRDYSRAGSPSVRYAREFQFSLDSFATRIVESFDAPAVATSDVDFWHRLTVETNTRLKIVPANISECYLPETSSSFAVAEPSVGFGLLDRERLMSLPKARKTADMKRILNSPQSEDWVTWNAFALVQKLAPDSWWEHLVKLALQENSDIIFPAGWQETPKVALWHCVSAPIEYEARSRLRMRTSGDPAWIERCEKPGPVEGESEIDITIRNGVMTVFIEAKLGSDISMRTNYDPDRNQIIRNIDCLLDEARASVPMFWMLVRDSGKGRSYTQLLQEYRRDPSKLAASLPHRSPAVLAQVAQCLSIILWKDLLQPMPHPSVDDAATLTVLAELRSRIG